MHNFQETPGNIRRGLNLKTILAVVAKRQYLIVLAIVVLAALVKFIYVFRYTEYGNYIYSDMGAYWENALARINGEDVNINQWIIWPPFYQIILSYFIRVIDLFGLTAYRLVIVKGLDVVLSTLSVAFLFGIAKRVAKGAVVPALLIALGYTLCYPITYLNAFVLSENLAIPLLIFSAWCAFKISNARGGETAGDGAPAPQRFSIFSIPPIDFLWLFLISLSLAIATAARPSFGLLGLLFFFFIVFPGVKTGRITTFFKNKVLRKDLFAHLVKGAFFSLIFFAFIEVVVLENTRISEGKLTGLGANGGVNFYFGQTKKYWLETRFDGYVYILVPPVTVDQPERGKLITDVPFYEQDYYFNLGLEYLKAHPRAILRNLASFSNLFSGPLFPSDASAAGFQELMPFSRTLLYVMTLCILLLLPFLARSPLLHRKRLLFILALPFYLLGVNVLYNIEQRYLFVFVFAIFILFVYALYAVLKSRGKIWKLFYLAGALAVILAAPYAVGALKASGLKDTVRATITQCEGYISSFDFYDPPPNGPVGLSVYETYVNSVRFREPDLLSHEDRGPLKEFRNNFFGVFESSFTVLEEGDYDFKLFADNKGRLIIDDQFLGEGYYESEEGYHPVETVLYLEKGSKHRIVVEYIMNEGDVSLIGTYQKMGSDDEDYHYFGENSRYMSFIEFTK